MIVDLKRIYKCKAVLLVFFFCHIIRCLKRVREYTKNVFISYNIQNNLHTS